MMCNYSEYFDRLAGGDIVGALRYACSVSDADFALLLGAAVYGRKYDVDKIRELLDMYKRKIEELTGGFRETEIYRSVGKLLSDLVKISVSKDELLEKYKIAMEKKLTELVQEALKKAIENPDKYASFLRVLGYDPKIVKEAKILKDYNVHGKAEEIVKILTELSEMSGSSIDEVYDKVKAVVDKLYDFFNLLQRLRGKVSEKTIEMYVDWLREVIDRIGDVLFYAFVGKNDFKYARKIVELAGVIGSRNAEKLEKLLVIYKKISSGEIPLDALIKIGKYLSGEQISLPSEYKVIADAIKELPEKDYERVVNALLYLAIHKAGNDPKKIVEIANAFLKISPVLATYYKKWGIVARDFDRLYERVQRWLRIFMERLSEGDIVGAENIYKYIDGQILKFYNEYRYNITKPKLEDTDYYNVFEFLRRFMKAELDFAKTYTEYYDRLKDIAGEIVVKCEPSDLGCLANEYGRLKTVYRRLALEGVDFSKVKEEVDRLEEYVERVKDKKIKEALEKMLDGLKDSIKKVEKDIARSRRTFQALSEVFGIISEAYLWLWNFLNVLNKIPSETYVAVRDEFKKYLENFIKTIRILDSMRYPKDLVVNAGEKQYSVNDLVKQYSEVFKKEINEIINEALKIGDERMYHDLEEIQAKYDIIKLPSRDKYQEIMKHAYPVQEVIENIIDYNRVFARKVFEELFGKKNPAFIPLFTLATAGLLGMAVIDIMTTLIRPREAERQVFFVLDGLRTLITNPAGWAIGASAIIRSMFSSPETAAESLAYLIAGFLLAKLISNLPTTRRIIADVLMNTMQADPLGLAGDILEVTGLQRVAAGFVRKLKGKEDIYIVGVPEKTPEIMYKSPELMEALKEIGFGKAREEVIRQLLVKDAKNVLDYLLRKYKTLKGIDIRKLDKEVLDTLRKDPEILKKLMELKYSIEKKFGNLIRVMIQDNNIEVKLGNLDEVLSHIYRLETDLSYADSVRGAIVNLLDDMDNYAKILRDLGLEKAAKVFEDYAEKLRNIARTLHTIYDTEAVLKDLEEIIKIRPEIKDYIRTTKSKIPKELDRILKNLEKYKDVEGVEEIYEKLAKLRELFDKDPVRAIVEASTVLGEVDDALSSLVKSIDLYNLLSREISELKDIVSKVISEETLSEVVKLRMLNLVETLRRFRKDLEMLAKKDPKYVTLVSALDNIIHYVEKTLKKTREKYILRITSDLDLLKEDLYRLSMEYPSAKWLLVYVDKIEELVKTGNTKELYKVLLDLSSKIDSLVPLIEKAKNLFRRALETLALYDPNAKKYVAEMLKELDNIISPPEKLKVILAEYYKGTARKIPTLLADPEKYSELSRLLRERYVYNSRIKGKRFVVVREPYRRAGEAGIVYDIIDPETGAILRVKYVIKIEGNPLALWLRNKFGKEVKVLFEKFIEYDPDVPAERQMYMLLKDAINSSSAELFKGLDLFTKYVYIPTPAGVMNIAKAISRGFIHTLMSMRAFERIYNYTPVEKTLKEILKKYGKVPIIINVESKTIPIYITNLKQLRSFLDAVMKVSPRIILYLGELQLPKELLDELLRMGVVTIQEEEGVEVPKPILTPTPTLPGAIPPARMPLVYIPLPSYAWLGIKKVLGKGLAKEKIAI